MLGERLIEWTKEQVAVASAEAEARGEARGEAHGLVTIIRRQIDRGQLTIDQARAEIRDLVATGEIPAEAGKAALVLLG